MSKIETRVAAALVADGKILLVNHRKRGRSYWVLPGGHVEFGETLSAAVVREMKEELDLDVTAGALLVVHDFAGADRHVVSHVFRVAASQTAFTLKPGKVLKGARWVPLEEFEKTDFLPPIAAQLRKVLEGPPGETLYLTSV